MKEVTTLDEAVQVLLAYSPRDMRGKYELTRIKKLMAFLGDPQNNMPVIHIAGTSGKTSTSYFIRGLLEAAGKRTGLTVSPHIAAVNERVQVDGEPLEATAFLAYLNQFLRLVRTTDIQPTYFELLIALAYWTFAKEDVDYAVIETGLGGLLDGTNVVSRRDKVCVLTDIGLDHTEILGKTLTEIATQKAGIIQPYNHVIMHRQSPEIMNVIERTVAQKHASLQIIDSDVAPEALPKFQRRNWALAMAVFEYLKTRDGLIELTKDTELDVATQMPPGRWEIYNYQGKTIILDGAHNPQKLQALIDSLTARSIYSAAVLANLVQAPEEKITESLAILQPVTTHLIIPEFKAGQDLKSRQSMDARVFAKAAENAGIKAIEIESDPEAALYALLERPDKVLIVTGSLYLVSRIRPIVRQLAD